MTRQVRTLISLGLGLLLVGAPFFGEAKTYSSGGRSYSSASSRSSASRSSGSWASSGGSRKSFNSTGGKSYSSGISWSDSNRRSYSASKSYASSTGRPAGWRPSPEHSGAFTFDTSAARARKEQSSKEGFTRFKDATRPPNAGPAYQSQPVLPRADTSGSFRQRTYTYIPDPVVLSTRPTRMGSIFSPYLWRPMVVYHDPYSSLFWWWLLDRSLEDRAWWAYHHHYDMDPARYQALLGTDQQLESRVSQLEAQQAQRDPTYVPAGLDRDLMYSDHYVNRAYANRSTTLGVVAFWALGVPTALAVCAFFIWLIWFKRWQTAT